MMNYHLDNQTYAKILTMTPRGDSDESPWLFLPDELLLYILSFLSQPDLARVASSCQHFYRVAMDESLWRNITLTKRTDLSDEMLCYIGQHSPQILRLLQCTGSTVTERGLRDLFKGCKDSLKELNFSGCSGGALTGDLVLLHASSRCHNITSLDASWSNATNNGAMAVADISKRLEVLCVNGCQSITDEALNYVVNRHGSTLQVLEVFGCFNIKQQCLLGMAQNCPNLRVLNMGQCYKVTDKLIRQMASKLKSLEVWDLRGCKQVQDESVHQIVRCCSGLQTVTLANCPLVTDVALVEIATYLPNVRCVDVSGCRNVTDFGVRAFANNSKQLTYIDLSSTAITTKSVTLLGSYCSRTLETVKLSFCDITESAVVKLVKNCPRLHTLHVIGCKRIRNDGAIKVANNKVAVELGRK
ncbi:S-phase kinase-associated protein 2-like isoform X2 [Branchiostoma floridae x Branchiostoma japonicum]